MKLAKPFLTILLALSVLGAGACTGTITDGPFQGVSDPNNPGGGDDGPRTPEEEEEARLCVGDGEAGGACEVTSDCNAPMVCLGGTCVGPQDPAYTCDPVEGIDCLQDGESCVNGLCVAAPGACETLGDCPNGFVCSSGQCTPERDGSVCRDPGPGPDMNGTWKVDSVLHLRDGLPNVVDKILDVSEDARDIMNGDLDLGLPSLVESVIGGIVAGIIRQFVPGYAIDIVTALGDMSDILDDMRIEGTFEMDGQECSGVYRGTHNWDFITIEFRGQEMRVRPNDLPGIDNVVPEEFAARYHCGDLLIDRHRVNNTLNTLVRFILDSAAQAISGHQTIEQSLASLVDCNAVGSAVNSAVQSTCSFCPSVNGVAAGACQGFVLAATAKLTEAIDEAAIKMSALKLSAVIPVNEDGTMGAGTWYGALAGGDFKGELTAAK